MNYEFPLWQPSRKYVCPPDAGPASREAWDADMDMAAVEDNLKLAPWERMLKHDRMMTNFLKREEFFTMMQRGKDFMLKMESGIPNRKSKI
jgi:hypothetical protein